MGKSCLRLGVEGRRPRAQLPEQVCAVDRGDVAVGKCDSDL
jgi:hypothetical protein